MVIKQTGLEPAAGQREPVAGDMAENILEDGAARPGNQGGADPGGRIVHHRGDAGGHAAERHRKTGQDVAAVAAPVGMEILESIDQV